MGSQAKALHDPLDFLFYLQQAQDGQQLGQQPPEEQEPEEELEKEFEPILKLKELKVFSTF